MGPIIARLSRVVLASAFVATAVVGPASSAAADRGRTELYITYYAEPTKQTVVGVRFYCNGQPMGFGTVSPYMTIETNDFC